MQEKSQTFASLPEFDPTKSGQTTDFTDSTDGAAGDSSTAAFAIRAIGEIRSAG
jgi:hypothetical protein